MCSTLVKVPWESGEVLSTGYVFGIGQIVIGIWVQVLSDHEP